MGINLRTRDDAHGRSESDDVETALCSGAPSVRTGSFCSRARREETAVV